MLFSGCKNNSEENEHKPAVTVEILRYKIGLNEYEFKISEDSSVVWFYPYQYLVYFRIINNSNYSSVIVIDDNMFNKGNKFAESSMLLDGVRYNIGSQTRRFIPPKGSISFAAFMTDYPLFIKPHSKKEFKKEFEHLVNNATYEFQFIENDYLADTVKVKGNIKIFPKLLGEKNIIVSRKSKDFEVVFINDFKEYDIYEIGFPFDSIPPNVTIFAPIEGVSY